ncbi:hypothetical protein VA596_26470 [Amycolatopsis sp., V23-08]|uniref:Uncharacterized protein n=1 Tax=Amycolatopsis heterodermiae TaxID=3110235 RepID=A0ABU5RA39_9PSEU|nr:hypothetical protein [Amycolatopsis sp., V23-08]MEA5363103.1 hypothetical protein [Amycolatopsis sp., V23-08]
MDGLAPGARLTGLPTLIRTDAGYRVHDPRLLAGGYTLTPAGRVTHRADELLGGLAVLLLLGPAIAFPILFAGGGFWSAVLWTALGAVAGLVLVGVELFLGPGDALERYRKQTAEEPGLDVTEEDTQAMRLCALGERIAKSTAWRTGAFDRDRRLEHVVWSAVRRALHGVEEAELTLIENRLRTIEIAADAIEFKVDPSHRPRRPAATAAHRADPLQDADLLVVEAGALRDYL